MFRGAPLCSNDSTPTDGAVKLWVLEGHLLPPIICNQPPGEKGIVNSLATQNNQDVYSKPEDQDQ